MVHAAAGVFDDEERVKAVQGDGVEVEQVAGQARVRPRVEELGPAGSRSTGRWVDAGVVQDLTYRGGADPVAEAGEFAVDASVAPGGVVGGQADGEGAEAGGVGWSAGSRVLGGPVAGDESLVPAQDGGGREEQPETSAGGQ
jgi:hypothetical protein